MTKHEKMNMMLSVIIVSVVVLVLVFITFNTNKNKVENTDTTLFPTGENTQQTEGVKVTVLKEGTGSEVKFGDIIAVNYTGTFEDGTVFDSNIGKEPFILTLGTTPVIPGWEIGISGMKEGEQRKLEINPDFAYGAEGVPGAIPPNAKLIFSVELIAIKK